MRSGRLRFVRGLSVLFGDVQILELLRGHSFQRLIADPAGVGISGRVGVDIGVAVPDDIPTGLELQVVFDYLLVEVCFGLGYRVGSGGAGTPHGSWFFDVVPVDLPATGIVVFGLSGGFQFCQEGRIEWDGNEEFYYGDNSLYFCIGILSSQGALLIGVGESSKNKVANYDEPRSTRAKLFSHLRRFYRPDG